MLGPIASWTSRLICCSSLSENMLLLRKLAFCLVSLLAGMWLFAGQKGLNMNLNSVEKVFMFLVLCCCVYNCP